LSIALLYERSEADEMGIRLTAEEMGIDLTYVPFRKIALSIGKKESVRDLKFHTVKSLELQVFTLH